MLVEMKDMLVSIWEMIDGHYPSQHITFYPKQQEFGYMLSMRNHIQPMLAATLKVFGGHNKGHLKIGLNTLCYKYGLMEA